MGTRCLVNFYNGKKTEDARVLRLYIQYDGYVHGGWGDEIREFLKKCRIVNGIKSEIVDGVLKNEDELDENHIVCNGGDDLALRFVTEYKKGIGNIYASRNDAGGEEYNYHIVVDYFNNEVIIECDEDADYYQTFVIGENGEILE